MSYTYHGTTGLIALPNRTVQTYPSGLVRVERSFVCRKTQVAKYRNILRVNELMPQDDGAPAIDGLYIFPEPQEIVRDDGFVEFRVTAYGRTNIFSEIAIERATFRGNYNITNNPAPWQTGQATDGTTPESLNETYTIRGVLPTSESASAILIKPNVESPIVIPFSTGIGWTLESSTRISSPLVNGEVFYGSGSNQVGGQTINFDIYKVTILDILLNSFSSTNFGMWSEYVITWASGANIFNEYRIKN